MLRLARGSALAALVLSVAGPISAADAPVVGGCRIEPATNCSFKKLEKADLRGADLADASLHGVVLTGANLEGANLQRADLQVGNLSQANLRDANLEGAHLFANDARGTQFQRANLRNVNLQDAHLGGANLQDVDPTAARRASVLPDGATCSDRRACAAPSRGACQ